MRILLLIDGLGSGGAQRQMITLAAMLKEQGQAVSFLLYSAEDFFQDEVKKMDIHIHHIHSKNYFQRIWRVRKYIRNGNYNAVISFMDTPNFLNNIAAIGGKNWKVITSERSSKEKFFFTKHGKIFGWFQRYSDTIVCNSYNAKEMWIKYYPSYTKKLKVIYNPVVLPHITSYYTPRINGKLNIVVAASYQYLKNPIGLINAISLMSQKERSELQIDWYGRVEVTKGDTRAYDESSELINRFQLQDSIRLNKENKDIANIMHKSDIIALFSRLEGLPNAICEGMMIGKPIIMTKVSDYHELIDESNGVLCDWDKPETIKNALLFMMKHSNQELISMGQQSKQKANRLFSKEMITDKWMDVIKK